MEFLKGADGIDHSSSDPIQAYMINGSWSDATIKHYNAGVSKLITFATTYNVQRNLLLPIDPVVLSHFVVWAGPKLDLSNQDPLNPPIKSNTIRTYLSGIKAWHLFHGHDYPHHATPKIEAILTAAKKLQLREEPRPTKNPVLIRHLFGLLESLANDNNESQVAYTVALIAFWGMARLGELVKSRSNLDQVKLKDVVWDPNLCYLKINIRAAKTAAVGEVQEIHCQSQNLLLDPVGAVKRMIETMQTTEDDPLFSYPHGSKRIVLTKARCQKIFSDLWERHCGTRLTGHSFRVGGASLRWNLNHPLDQIVAVGRWKSKAYKLYIREYSDADLINTLRLLESIQYTC